MTRYSMKYRPPGFCTLPKGLEWDYVEVPSDSRRFDLPVSSRPYGIFTTDRPLTPEELEAFEIRIEP